MRDTVVVIVAAAAVIAAGLYLSRRQSPLPARFAGVKMSGSPDRIINPWPDTEASYAGSWTASGPLDLATYDKQIYD